MKISTLLINSTRSRVLFLAVLCCLAMKPGIAVSQNTTTGAVSSPQCSGSIISVTFTSTGTFTSNTYTAQLSSSTGVFPGTDIGTLTSNANSGTISATIPVATTGTGYKIRVTASNPSSGTFTPSGIITISQGPGTVTVDPVSITDCYGSLNSMTATTQLQSVGATAIDLHGTFETASNPSMYWGTTNASTGGTPANAAWTLRANNYIYNAAHTFFFFFPYTNRYTFNAGSQFYLSNSSAQGGGTTGTTLFTKASNAVNTNNYTSLTLNFSHNLRVRNNGDLAAVQVSTDGGTTWKTPPVQTYNSQQGTETFTGLSGSLFGGTLVLSYTETLQPASVDLSAYINVTDLRIRFAYTATSGSGDFFPVDNWWAIDNVTLTGSGAAVTPARITWGPIDGYLYTQANFFGVYDSTFAPSFPTVYGEIASRDPASPQTYVAVAQIGACKSISSPVSLTVSSNYVWTGVYGPDWNDYRNWCSGNVPADNNVTIPGGTPYAPIINDNGAGLNYGFVKNIDIDGGTTVDLNGYTLYVDGVINAIGQGTLTGGNTSGVDFSNTSTGTVYFTPNSYPGSPTNNYLQSLSIGGASTITLGDSLNITGGTASSTFGTLTVNGSTFNTNNFLTLKSNQYGDAQVGQSVFATINGNVVVERYIPYVRAWRFLSVPVNTSLLTIRDAWAEGSPANISTSPTNDLKPGFGTEITYLQGSTANGYDENITSNPSIKVWDVPSQGWAPLPSIKIPITNYPAYCLFVRGNRAVNLANGVSVAPANAQTTVLRNTGTLNTGTVTQNFGTVANASWILAKNPYASPINMQSGVTYNNIASTYFEVWDPKIGGTNGVGKYVSWSTANGGTWSDPSGSYPGGTGNLGIVQSGQAFFVQASTANNPKSIVITEVSKWPVEYSTSGFSSPESPVTQENSISVVENSTSNVSSANSSVIRENSKPAVENSTSGVSSPKSPVLYAQLILPTDSMKVSDGVAVTFGKRFSAAKDSFDVPKRWNEQGENMALVRDSNTFAIECRPVPVLNDTLFFRVYLKQQPYALRIFALDLPENLPGKAWLVDNYLNTQTEVNPYDTTVYSFTPNTDTNSYRNRFMLVLNRKPVTRGTREDNPGTTGNANSIVVYPNPIIPGGKAMLKLNDLPKGNYEITVINSAGNTIKKKTFVHAGGSSTYDIQTGSRWVAGNYVLTITGENGYSYSTNLVVGK